MSGEFLMGYPHPTVLRPLPARRVRAVRQRASVKGMVFAEFARAIQTPRRSLTPDSVGGAVQT